MRLSYLLFYLFFLCLIGFVIMGLDKWKAKHGRYRISEKTLFLVALLGGAVGSTIGMQVFRHKTRHWYFRFGLPALALIQILLLAGYVFWLTFLRS